MTTIEIIKTLLMLLTIFFGGACFGIWVARKLDEKRCPYCGLVLDDNRMCAAGHRVMGGEHESG